MELKNMVVKENQMHHLVMAWMQTQMEIQMQNMKGRPTLH